MRTYDEIWIGCMNEPNGLLRWIECHSSLASYLQAVGVVGSLALVVWIENRSAQKEDRSLFASEFTRLIAIRPLLSEMRDIVHARIPVFLTAGDYRAALLCRIVVPTALLDEVALAPTYQHPVFRYIETAVQTLERWNSLVTEDHEFSELGKAFLVGELVRLEHIFREVLHAISAAREDLIEGKEMNPSLLGTIRKFLKHH